MIRTLESLKANAITQQEAIEQAVAEDWKTKRRVFAGEITQKQAEEFRQFIEDAMREREITFPITIRRLHWYGIGRLYKNRQGKHVQRFCELCNLIVVKLLRWKTYNRDQAKAVIDQIDKFIEELS